MILSDAKTITLQIFERALVDFALEMNIHLSII